MILNYSIVYLIIVFIFVHTFVYTLNFKRMKVITTREMRNDAKTYFELAEKESVVVKRGKNKYVNLVITNSPDKKFFTDDWLKEFFEIPAEYRVNPFNVSPSGDLFWADKRNVEHVDKAIEEV